MGALLGGLVGACASVATWLAAEHFQQANYGWMVCLVGLVTGCCVNKSSASGSGGFARGAMAMVLTLAAIVGGQKGYAMIMQATTSTAGQAVESVLPVAEDAENAEEEETATASATPLPELEAPSVGLIQRGYSKSAMKKNFGEWDMIWMCVAALAAYVSGKGAGSDAPDDSGEEAAAEPKVESTNESDEQ